MINQKFKNNSNFKGIIYHYPRFDEILKLFYDTNKFAIENVSYDNQNEKIESNSIVLAKTPQENVKEEWIQIFIRKLKERIYLNENTISNAILFYTNFLFYELSKAKREKLINCVKVDFSFATDETETEGKLLDRFDTDFSDSIFDIVSIKAEKIMREASNEFEVIFNLVLTIKKLNVNDSNVQSFVKSVLSPINRNEAISNEKYEVWNQNTQLLAQIKDF
jgi:hypothetical protein